MQMTTTCSAGGLTISLSSLSAIWVEETSRDFSCGLRKGTTPAGTPNMILPQRVKCCRPAGQSTERSQPCPNTQCASVRCVSLGQSWPRELLPTEAFQLRSTLLSQGPVRPRGAAQGGQEWAVMLSFAGLRTGKQIGWCQVSLRPALSQSLSHNVHASAYPPATSLVRPLGSAGCLCIHMKPRSNMLAKCSIAVGSKISR